MNRIRLQRCFSLLIIVTLLTYMLPVPLGAMEEEGIVYLEDCSAPIPLSSFGDLTPEAPNESTLGDFSEKQRVSSDGKETQEALAWKEFTEEMLEERVHVEFTEEMLEERVQVEFTEEMLEERVQVEFTEEMLEESIQEELTEEKQKESVLEDGKQEEQQQEQQQEERQNEEEQGHPNEEERGHQEEEEAIEEPIADDIEQCEADAGAAQSLLQQMDERSRLEAKVRESYELLKKYYEDHPPEFPYISENLSTTSSSNYWIFSALWGAGYTDLKNDFPWQEDKSPFEPFSFWTIGKKQDALTTVGAKDDAGTIIGAILLGKDPRKFGNEWYRRDIVQELINKQKGDGSFSDQWGEPWVLIALDLVDAEYDRQAHLEYILRQQTSGGSFGGADATGWTLIALAPYMDQPEVKEAIDKAVNWVHSKRRLTDGEIPGQMGVDNSNSVAAIIHGLAAVGEDLLSEKWTLETTGYGRVNIVERFIDRYQMDDGRFKWRDQNIGDWNKASEQALLAFLEVLNEGSTFQQLYDYRRQVLDQTTRVSLGIEGRNATIRAVQDIRVETIAEGANVLDALKQALAEQEISLSTQGTGENPVIKQIGDDQQGFPDPRGSWHVLVNGQKLQEGINQYVLSSDDQVMVYYGNEFDLYPGEERANTIDKLTLIPKISMKTERLLEGKSFEIEVAATYSEYNEQQQIVQSNIKIPIEGASVSFNGKSYPTNMQGIVRIPAEEARVGTYELRVAKDSENSYPRLLRTVKTIHIDADREIGNPGQPSNPPAARGSVSIAVHGPLGEGYLLAPLTLNLEPGDTAFSVLDRAMPGRVNAVGNGSSIYVRSIAGLGEFDRGPDSGWMYSVNGSFPNYSAGSYVLSDGDYIEWRYTTNLGQDIGGYLPGAEAGRGGGSGANPSPEEIKEILTRLSFLANNQKPVHEIGTTVIVLNQDQRMSEQAAQALQQRLEKNRFSLTRTVSPATDGTLQDAQQEVILFVPKNAISKTTEFKIEKQREHMFAEAVSGVFTFAPAGAKFAEPVQISILTPFLIEDLEQLALAWWNTKTKRWIPIPATVDAQSGYVTGIVDHFTTFAVIDKAMLGIKPQNKHTEALKNALEWIKQKDEWSEWDVIALAQAGERVPGQYLKTLAEWLLTEQGEFRKVTDYERFVLALTAIGEDPTTFAGYNLIEKIYNNERMTLQGINGPTFALIALDSRGYKVPANAAWGRESLIKYIIEQQKKDGGFSLSSTQGESDVDITAMVIQGLTSYQHQKEIKEVLDKAIHWLSVQQNEAGGYTNSFNEVNSESVAQVMIALTGLGIDPDKDERFVKAKGSLLSNLLSYVTKDGGFAHVHGQPSNDIATEQAALALVAYDRYLAKQPALYDMRNSQPQGSLPYLDADKISPWALEAVQQAWELQIMQGVGTGTPRFEPNRAMTRAEFATMLLKLMNEQGVGQEPKQGAWAPTESSFKDVSKTDWFYTAISTVVAQGWMQGRTTEIFDPKGEITREEIAVILGRLLPLEEEEVRGVKQQLVDYEEVAAWAKPYVSQVYQEQIMLGDGYRFNPKAKVTREMAAVMMIRLIEFKQ